MKLTHLRTISLAVAAVTVACSLAACSSEQLYGAGQAWKQQECSKIADAAERGHCMGSMSRSFDDYQRESAAAKGR